MLLGLTAPDVPGTAFSAPRAQLPSHPTPGSPSPDPGVEGPAAGTQRMCMSPPPSSASGDGGGRKGNHIPEGLNARPRSETILCSLLGPELSPRGPSPQPCPHPTPVPHPPTPPTPEILVLPLLTGPTRGSSLRPATLFRSLPYPYNQDQSPAPRGFPGAVAEAVIQLQDWRRPLSHLVVQGQDEGAKSHTCPPSGKSGAPCSLCERTGPDTY